MRFESSKLIHGGLRYLEHYEFQLVREALIEREVLLNLAPHIIRPLRFVLPHHSGLRPRWMIRLGLWLYDNLGGRRILPGTRSLDLAADVAGGPLESRYTRGFEYSDCWVDDARLVVLNARDAADRGADIRTRTECVAARRTGDRWTLDLASDGRTSEAHVRVLVNAAGVIATGTMEATSDATWDQMMNVNVRGPFRLMRAAAPHLKARQGNIVNVSSVNGLRAFAGVLAYNVSKAAMDHLTRCAALEMAPFGVRVNCVRAGGMPETRTIAPGCRPVIFLNSVKTTTLSEKAICRSPIMNSPTAKSARPPSTNAPTPANRDEVATTRLLVRA